MKLDPESVLDDTELTSLNVTMLAAGLDTMHGAVTWGIAMLAMMPEIQSKAVSAIRQTYADDQPLCDANEPQTCQYLVNMIREIFR